MFKRNLTILTAFALASMLIALMAGAGDEFPDRRQGGGGGDNGGSCPQGQTSC